MRIERRPIVKREIERFQADPSSIRKAAWVIVTVTVASVLLGTLVMWLLTEDFADFGTAFWFTLQTITTVGYGDVTPTTQWGRVVASVVMVVAIGFLAIVTALITSTFVEAAGRQRRQAEVDAELEAAARTEARLEELVQRLEAIEASLERLQAGRSDPPAAGAGAPEPRE
jgi:voltage-gated potassium channel